MQQRMSNAIYLFRKLFFLFLQYLFHDSLQSAGTHCIIYILSYTFHPARFIQSPVWHIPCLTIGNVLIFRVKHIWFNKLCRYDTRGGDAMRCDLCIVLVTDIKHTHFMHVTITTNDEMRWGPELGHTHQHQHNPLLLPLLRGSTVCCVLFCSVCSK